MECPVCKYHGAKIQTLLRKVTDEDLLVQLAIDFAYRVCHLPTYPDASQELLDIARTKRGDILQREWHEAFEIWGEEYAKGLDAQRIAAARALEKALWAAWRQGGVDAARFHKAVLDAAINASFATDDQEAEDVWQVAHIRREACTCVSPGPGISRLRKSLLAS